MLTPTFTNEAFAALGAPQLVYVRPIEAREILSQIVIETEGEGPDIQPDQILYAVHGADGARLAVLADRDMAYAAAYAHELAPVSVH